jgi:transposase-like protein
MSGRQSSAVEAAVKEYRRTKGGVYRIAARHKVAASSLYRAIRGVKKKA